VPCDARGVPQLRALPTILGKLEEPATRAAGAHCIAALIDGTSGEAALLLGEYMRDAGVLELLVRLLGGEQDERTNCWLLTALGNAASDVVDGNASTTRELLAGLAVIPCVQAHLQSPRLKIRLHAAAAMQNLCQNAEMAAEAVRGGAHRVLERLCGAAETDERVKHFAAGTLVNVEAMLNAAPKRRGRDDEHVEVTPLRSPRPQRVRPERTPCRVAQVNEAAHAAMEWRRRKEQAARSAAAKSGRGFRLRKGKGGASSEPFSRAVHPAAASPAVPRGGDGDGLPERLEILTVQPPTEEALQTRIPLDVAKARSHAQRQRGRDEHSASGRSHDSGYDSPSSNSSWSFFTARSGGTSASASAQGDVLAGASEPEELSASTCGEV
jgi:hypothetical protein